jgi:hypothetical protein
MQRLSNGRHVEVQETETESKKRLNELTAARVGCRCVVYIVR